MIRFIFYLIGIYMISISITFIIIYFNLLNVGYNFIEYVNFIIRRIEVLLFVPGVILLFISLFKKKGQSK